MRGCRACSSCYERCGARVICSYVREPTPVGPRPGPRAPRHQPPRPARTPGAAGPHFRALSLNGLIDGLMRWGSDSRCATAELGAPVPLSPQFIRFLYLPASWVPIIPNPKMKIRSPYRYISSSLIEKRSFVFVGRRLMCSDNTSTSSCPIASFACMSRLPIAAGATVSRASASTNSL